MRISSNLFFQTGLNSITAQQSDLLHLYEQIGSGKRMVTPADDPLAAAQAVNISQSQSLNARFGANRAVANTNLATEENALTSMTLLLQDLKTNLIAAGNGTLSDADRATLSNVLTNARDSMLGLANTTDGSGQYLFSGAQGGSAAYQDVNGTITYMGDAGQRKIQADQTRQIAGSDVGSDIFNRAAPGTTNYLTAAATNSLSNLGNAGTGLISTPTITNPNEASAGNTYAIKFSETIPNSYTVEINDRLGALVGTTTGSWDPASGTSIGLPLGVQVKFSGSPALGDSFVVEPANTSSHVASPTTSGDARIGSPVVSDYSITRPGDVYSIAFTDVDEYTVSVTNPNPLYPTITQAGEKFVPGRENTLTLPHGMEVKISGSPVAGNTFTIQAAATQTNLDMFATLDGIIKSLELPIQDSPEAQAAFQNNLATAMQRLDVNYNNILTVRASVGARMNELDAIGATGSARSLSYSAQLSKLEDVDYYTATTQLQLRSTALEAASLAFKKIQSLGLFNTK
ncbi:flagellar hook-associated protein 3 [Pollutimonas nitritireducens]|uniref:Flagellar hook-associated protein 3 n=1 Tax=Pollutimonas nitritireducens TaxID=2045209 RepID=A0A2N4UB34_9BURK|nr:flagellar hook-associated protein FlgL [Pollutimonas nitritireducens]PLC52226.1 flagellar hook-associated protein 3 [Pollutimonas nitritireducens]